MPIFELNGKKYNVQDQHIADFASEYPDATTIEERDGKKYRVKSSDYQSFQSEIGATQPEVQTPYALGATPVEKPKKKGLPEQDYIYEDELQKDRQGFEKEQYQGLSWKDKAILRVMGKNARQMGVNADPAREILTLDKQKGVGLNDLEERKNVMQAQRNQVSTMRDEIDQILIDTQDEDQFAGIPMAGPMGATMSGMRASTRQNNERRDYMAAKRSLTDAANIIEEADRHAADGTYGGWYETSFAGGAARGFGDKLFDARTWSFGVADKVDNDRLNQALEDFDNGKELTKSQQALLDAKAVEMATQAYFGSYLGRGYKAGQVTAEAIPFMVEMAINPASAMGKSAGSMMARYALNRFGKGAATKALSRGARVVGDIAGAATMSATTGLGRVAADATERMAGDIHYDIDQDNQTVFAGHTKGEDPATAYRKAFGATTIENYSEMFGNYFSPILGGSGKMLRKGAESLGAGKVVKMLDDVAASDLAKVVSDFEKNAQWSGTLSEYAEEVAGGIMNAIFVGDQTLDTDEQTGVFNLDNNINTLLGVALLGGAMSTIKTAGYPIHKYQADKRIVMAETDAVSAFGNAEKWAEVKSQLNLEDAVERGKALRNVLADKNLTEEQKVAAFKYVEALQNRDGVRIGEMKHYTDETVPQEQKEIEQSFDNGYTLATPEEKQDANSNLAYWADKLRVDFHMNEDADPEDLFEGYENPLDALKDERFANEDDYKDALQYIYAKATMDGAVQNVRDQIDARIAENNARIDGVKNETDNTLMPATLKQGDRQVFIVRGNIAQLDDGSIDGEKSDGHIFIVDAQTLKPEMIAPSAILSLGAIENADTAKETQATQIAEQMATEASAQMDGTLGFMQGDTYNILGEDGIQHTAQVIADNGDGSVQIVVDGAQEATTLPKDQVQAMSDAYHKARAIAYNEQKKAQEVAEQEAQAEQTAVEDQGEVQPPVREVPKQKDGKPDYNAMDADMFTEQYVSQFGEEVTETVARNNIKEADKAIETFEKQISGITDPNKLPDLYEKLQGAKALRAKYATVIENLGLSEDANEDNASRVKRMKKDATPRIAQLFPDGLPNVESVILADIATGNKIRWSDKVVNGAVVSKGLGSELGLTESNSERTRRIALIGKDAPTPEEYAEQLRERLDAMGIRYDENELRDKVLDVYAVADTRNKAWAELEAISANMNAEQEGLNYEEEQMRKAYEQEQNAIRQEEQTKDFEQPAPEIPTQEEYEQIVKKFDKVEPQKEKSEVEKKTRKLTSEEADVIISAMEENATPAPEVELTPENWVAEFGENGVIETPIGDVKMGDNQYLKLQQRKRSQYFGMIRPTLENPDIVLEEYDPADGAERDTKMLFVKTFIKADGSRYIHFESVTVRKEDKEVSISSHEVNAEDLKKKMHNDNVVHLNDLFSDSEVRLTRPQVEGSDLVPTPNSSDSKYTTSVPKSQEVEAEISQENAENVAEEQQTTSEAVAQAEAETNIEPTEAQKEAGNYKKGHVVIDGLNITIENPKGSERSGIDENGQKWSVKMNNTYGYIRHTEGKDGDHIDLFLSDHLDDWNGDVYVVDQINPKDGSFDEHKVMYGFNSIEEAEQAYMSNYSIGWKGLGSITGTTKEEFKKWLDSSHRKTKPFAEYKNVKKEERTATKFLSEDAYVQSELDKEKPEGMDMQEYEETDEYVDAYNAAIDSYASYIEGLAKSGELQKMYDSATIGEQIEIRKGVEAAGFEFRDLVTPKKVAKKAKKSRGQELMDNLGLQSSAEDKSTPEVPQEAALSPEERAAQHPNPEQVLFEMMLIKAYQSGNNERIEDTERFVRALLNRSTNVDALKEVIKRYGTPTQTSDVEQAEIFKRTADFIKNVAEEKIATLQPNKETKKDKSSSTMRSAKPKKADDAKIEDFGEKIGGARKDVARARLRDSAKLSLKDLETIKDPDKILSRKAILKYLNEGAMTEQDAITLLALNMAARGKSGKRWTLDKYRSAALQWEAGKDIVVEITEQEVDEYVARLGERAKLRPNVREKSKQDLEYIMLTPYNDYKATYEALNYPTVYRDLRGTYVSKGFFDGRYWVKSNIDARKGFVFNTMEQAVARIRRDFPPVEVEQDKEAAKTVNKDEKIGHINITKDDYGWYRLKSRSIPGNIYLSGRFRTKKEAEAYLEENKDMLLEREQKMTESLMGSNIGMVDRQGIDYRQGRDITPEEFRETFGFRGVEFGNWVPQAERQLYLNKTYDAIMDFCKVVGISPKAFSLGGELALAFGSRGKSRALAHYEPLKMVINLTRMKGAGSLAHEWFHALDNYLAKNKSGNITDMVTARRIAVRPEVANVFREFVDKMNSMDYTKRSKNAGEYWGEVWERAARLLESYIYNELESQSTVSPLLVRKDALFDESGQAVEDFAKSVWPYPSERENAEIKPYFDKLFSTLEEKVDEQGNVILFRDGEDADPTFYSNAEAAVRSIKQEKATPEQWLKMIEKNGGLKAGEDKWLGLSDWLKASDKKTLTKQEVLDFINENKIQIEEVEYGDGIFSRNSKMNLESELQAALENGRSIESALSRWDNEFGDNKLALYERGFFTVDEKGKIHTDEPVLNHINNTRLNYTTYGLENKREIALVVPTIESWNTSDQVHFGDAGNGRAIAWVRFGETTDSDGKRVLVIDEIQSKRHQEGRERGYKVDISGEQVAKALEDAGVAHRILESFDEQMAQKYGTRYWTDQGTNEEYAHWELLRSEANRYDAIYHDLYDRNRKGIPDAPFEKNWAELAMKRMLRYAAENGYEKVAWTKGDQQNERYQISHVVDVINLNFMNGDNGSIRMEFTNGGDHHVGVDKSTGLITFYNEQPRLIGKPLSDLLGKQLAEKIISNKIDYGTIKGDGLNIGGEGMRAFYDQILPSFMNKYGKKWGATVQDVTLPNVEEAGRTMHSVDVTESMRESVMQGQPMFRVADSKKPFKELEERYKKLNKANVEALNAWRDEKAATIQSVITAISDELGFEPPIMVFNGGKDIQEVVDHIVDAYKEMANLEVDKEWVKTYIEESKAIGLYWPDAGVITSDVSNYDNTNDVLQTSSMLMHENTHHLVNSQFDNQDLEAIWDEAVNAGHPLVNHIENKYKNVANGEKGNEVLAYAIGNIAKNTRETLFNYVKGEPISEENLLEKAEFSLPLGKFALSEILNTYKNDLRRSKKEVGGSNREANRGDYRVGRLLRDRIGIRRKAVKEAAELFAKQLNTPIRIVEDVNTITDNNAKLQERKRNAKGWFDNKANEVVVVLPNATSVEDVRETIFHEVVGHKGLRELVGKERYDAFLEKVYRGASETIRERIASRAAKLGWDFNLATDEYLADLAEEGFEDRENRNFFEVVRDLFLDMLSKAKIALGYNISDNDMRYMLWRTYQMQRSKGAMGIAEDMVMQQKLGVGNFAPSNTRLRVAAEQGSLSKRVSDIIEEYDDSEEIFTIEDVADRIEELLNEYDGNESTTALENILNDYRDAQSEANRYGHRWDAGGEEEFEEALRLYGAQLPQFRADDDVRFRAVSPSKISTNGIMQGIRNKYDKLVKTSAYQSREASQDSMLSLRRFMEMTAKAYEIPMEQIKDWENAYQSENALSSKNEAQIEEFDRLYGAPLIQTVQELRKKGYTYEQIDDYLQIKHGIERNREMAVRAAISDEEGKMDNEKLEKWNAAKERVSNDQSLDSWEKEQRELDRIAKEEFDAEFNRDYSGLTAMYPDEKKIEDAVEKGYAEVNDFEKNVGQNLINELWRRIRAANMQTLNKTYRTGLISKDTFDSISNMYSYYVPLRGFAETTSDEVYGYLNNEPMAFNAPIRKARGRSSKADQVLPNVLSAAHSAILQGNRNTMKNHFLNFVQHYPTDLISVQNMWVEYDKATKQWVAKFPELDDTDSPEEVATKTQAFEEKMKELKEKYPNQYKQVTQKIDVPYIVQKQHLKQHQIVVKRNGVDVVLTVNGSPRLAIAMNGTQPTTTLLGKAKDLASTATRYLSGMYTSYNPDFVVSNYIRDAIYTNATVWLKESPAYAARFNRNKTTTCTPINMGRLILKYSAGTLDMNNEVEKAFYDFVMNGGETGYAKLASIEQLKKDIGHMIEPTMFDNVKALGKKLAFINRSAESSARFAAFLTSRQMGRSVARSVADAKEISVNFNKKGAGDLFMDAKDQTWVGKRVAGSMGWTMPMYAFFNAGIQGLNNFLRIYKHAPLKTTALTTGLFLLGALIASMLEGDDEEEYYALPESVRRQNIVFRAGDNAWVKIPLPIEMRAIYGLGDMFTSIAKGKEDLSEHGIAYKMAEQLLQVLPINVLEGKGGLGTLVPTVAAPFAEAMANEDWTGLPIYRKDIYEGDEGKPEYLRVYPRTGKGYVAVSKALNDITGGDNQERGALGFVNPAFIEHLVDGYLGGPAQFMNKVVSSVEMAFGDKEFDLRAVPFVNRVLMSDNTTMSNKTTNNYYYKHMKDAKEIKRLLNGYTRDSQDPNFTEEERAEAAAKAHNIRTSEEWRKAQEFLRRTSAVEDIEKQFKEAPEGTSDEVVYKVKDFANEVYKKAEK